MFSCSCARQAEVAVNGESKLQSQNCRSYWNLEVFARVPRLESNYGFNLQIAIILFCDM